jgi:hypothetical protein
MSFSLFRQPISTEKPGGVVSYLQSSFLMATSYKLQHLSRRSTKELKKIFCNGNVDNYLMPTRKWEQRRRSIEVLYGDLILAPNNKGCDGRGGSFKS